MGNNEKACPIISRQLASVFNPFIFIYDGSPFSQEDATRHILKTFRKRQLSCLPLVARHCQAAYCNGEPTYCFSSFTNSNNKMSM